MDALVDSFKPLRSSQKLKVTEALPNRFHETIITLIPKADYQQKRFKSKILDECKCKYS